jgi:hypothetical protein
MADDWIKMRTALQTDPDVFSICAATGLDKFAVVGRLHAMWSWFDTHTADGYARGVTISSLDRELCHEGFCAAVAASPSGWLVIEESGVRMAHFDHHNGKSGKTRALTARRMGMLRCERNDSATSASQNGNGGVTREEKRREESNTPPNPLSPERGNRLTRAERQRQELHTLALRKAAAKEAQA